MSKPMDDDRRSHIHTMADDPLNYPAGEVREALLDLLAENEALRKGHDDLALEVARLHNSPSVEELIAYLDGMLDVLLMPSRLEDAARSYLQDRES